MPSEVRKKIFETMRDYSNLIEPLHRNWRVLEVGIDGDPKPAGNFEYFGQGNTFETLDFLERLKPTYVADIQDTKLDKEMFKLVICSQVLEHVYEPIKAIHEIFRITKKGGYAILDAPFEHPYHDGNGYGDYWRITPLCMKEIAKKAGFEMIFDKSTNLLTSILVGRPT